MGSLSSHVCLNAACINSFGDELTFGEALFGCFFGDRKAYRKVLQYVHLVLAFIQFIFHIISKGGGGCSTIASRGCELTLKK